MKIYRNPRLTFPYKVNTKKERLEDFKTAISSTVRTLSNSKKIEVFFGKEISNSEKNSIKLPALEQQSNKINYKQIRAIADSESLRLRFSSKKIYKKFEPEGNISKKLYSISEKIRTIFLGAGHRVTGYLGSRMLKLCD